MNPTTPTVYSHQIRIENLEKEVQLLKRSIPNSPLKHTLFPLNHSKEQGLWWFLDAPSDNPLYYSYFKSERQALTAYSLVMKEEPEFDNRFKVPNPYAGEE